jgi:hypothetical protein
LSPGLIRSGRIPGKKVGVECQARGFFHHGNAIFFRGTGVYSAFINDNVPFGDDFAHGFRSPDQRGQVRAVVFVDGRGHGDDVDVAAGNVIEVCGAEQAVGRRFLGERILCEQHALQDIIFDFQGGVVAGHQFRDTGLVDVISHDRVSGGKEPGQGEAYVAEADNCDFHKSVKF